MISLRCNVLRFKLNLLSFRASGSNVRRLLYILLNHPRSSVQYAGKDPEPVSRTGDPERRGSRVGSRICTVEIRIAVVGKDLAEQMA